MSITTPAPRRLGRTDKPFNPDRRIHPDFTRQATIAAFGRHARALDQANFVDRRPDQAPRRLDGHLAREVV